MIVVRVVEGLANGVPGRPRRAEPEELPALLSRAGARLQADLDRQAVDHIGAIEAEVEGLRGARRGRRAGRLPVPPVHVPAVD